MTDRFDEEVRRLDEQLASQHRTAAEVEEGRRRLFEEIERARPPRRSRLLAPAMALAGLAIAFLLLSRDVPPERVRIIEQATCVARAADEITVSGRCASAAEILIDRDRLVVEPGAELRLRSRGVQLARGRTRFSIARRETLRDRFEVSVSHGVIVVIGTRFQVEQRAGGGRVDVEEGTVEFRWADGAPPEQVGAGASLAWPRPPAPPPPPVPIEPPEPGKEPTPEARMPAKRPKRRAPVRMSADALMKRLLRLRSQRRYDEAIDLLREGSHRGDFTKVQRERLSFELGNLLRQSGREKEACRHLERHLKRFPSTPRKAELEADIARCRTDVR